MKVIMPGREQDEWSVGAMCRGVDGDGGGCGAHLLIEQEDLFLTYSGLHYGTKKLVSFRCECCGVITNIDNVPSHIRVKLPLYQEWLRTHSGNEGAKGDES